MRADRYNDDGTVALSHEGHRFRVALAAFRLARRTDGGDDPLGVVGPAMACLDGDGYRCEAVYWPLLGDRDAQRMVVRASVALGHYPDAGTAWAALAPMIEAHGGTPRP